MNRPSALKTSQAAGASKLSRAWRVSKQHRGIYTGGKWQCVPTLPLRLAETLDQDNIKTSNKTSELDGLVFSLCDGDVSVVRVSTGELIMTVQGRYDLASHDTQTPGTARASDAKAGSYAKIDENSAFIGEDIHEEIVEFAVHPQGHEIVTVSRQLLMRHWVLTITEEVQLLVDDRTDDKDKDTATTEATDATDATKATEDATKPSGPVRLRASWENVRSWKSQHRTAVTSMAYDPSGTLVATAGAERVVKVWDVPRGYCTHNLKMSNGTKTASAGAVSLVKFHPNETRLTLFACTEDDNAIRVYDLRTSSLVATHTNHMSTPTSLGFSKDGWTMISGGRDKVVNLYDLKSNTLLRTAPVYEAIEGVAAFEPNNKNNDVDTATTHDTTHWLTCGDGGHVRAWKFSSHKKRRGKGATSFDCVGKSNGSHTATNMEGSKKNTKDTKEKNTKAWTGMTQWTDGTIVTTTRDHNFEFWNVTSSAASASASSTSSSNSSSNSSSSSPSKRSSSVPSVFSNDLQNEDAVNESNYILSRKRQIVGYNDDIIDLKFIPPHAEDGGASRTDAPATDIVVATNSPDLRIVNLETFDTVLIEGHRDIVLAVDVSSDGRYVTSVSKDRTVNVHRLKYNSDGQVTTVHVGSGRGHTEIVGAVAFGNRPMGKGNGPPPILLTGSLDKTIKAWDIKSMLSALDAMEDDDDEDEDEKNEDDELKERPMVMELRVRTSVRGHESDINKMVVSPNDKMAASASQDKTIRLWSMESLRDDDDLRLLHTLKGHKRGVWDVAFSPVDRMLASASGDGSVRLWSLSPDALRSSPCVRTFEGHTASVLRVSFVSAGLQVMSGGADGLVKLWTLRGTATECVGTFDRHRDKIWAMASRPWVGTSSKVLKNKEDQKKYENNGGKDKDGNDGNVKDEEEPSVQTQVVTGGGDSILNVWVDCTSEEDAEEIQKRELMLLKEQELANLVHQKRYGRAIKLALELDFPLKLRTILEELLLGEAPKSKVSLRGIDLATRAKYGGKKGELMVRLVMSKLSENHLSQCLKYISIWNTNARRKCKSNEERTWKHCSFDFYNSFLQICFIAIALFFFYLKHPK